MVAYTFVLGRHSVSCLLCTLKPKIALKHVENLQIQFKTFKTNKKPKKNFPKEPISALLTTYKMYHLRPRFDYSYAHRAVKITFRVGRER